jgi:hypothetical protein
MDNRIISVQSHGRKAFDLAFELLFENQKATHYFEHPQKGLVFLWAQDLRIDLPVSIKLPTPLTWQGAAELAWTWLMNQPDNKYQDDLDDYDVSNIKAFKVYNEDWGYVADSRYGILGVVPVWGWLGK